MKRYADSTSISNRPTLTLLQRQHDQNDHPKHKTISLADLVLIRGLPGSGKSTMASVLSMIGYKHYEADMYFERDGAYQYDPSLVRDAHVWCQQKVRNALDGGHKVVVSNTFTRMREMEPYLRLARGTIQILEANGSWENVHDVPSQVLNDMSTRWEVLPTYMKTRFENTARNIVN